MTTANYNKGLNIINDLITALYCRLSVEDIKDENGKKKRNIDESNSISNQKQILSDYAKKHGYTNTMFFVDDGISRTSFDRSDFNRMQRMVEEGKIGTIIVKDLSRFGREQVEAGRLTQIDYPSLGATFISIQENVNSTTGEGMEMLPFYNIFNEWYAAQTSKKIRDVVLEDIVKEAISGLADFVKCHEAVFLYMLAKKNSAMQKAEYNRMKLAVERDEKRIKNIDRLIKSLYEDKVLGELEDDRYTTLMAEYEKEQRELIASVAAMRKTLESTDQKAVDLRLLLKTLRELTDVNELTPTIVNSLIDRIEVHNNDKSSGHCYVKVDIYFSAVGMIDIPTAEEIRAMIEEIKKDPQQFRYVA